MKPGIDKDEHVFENDELSVVIRRVGGFLQHRIQPRGAAADLYIESMPASSDAIKVESLPLRDLAFDKTATGTVVTMTGELDAHIFTVRLTVPKTGKYVHLAVQDELQLPSTVQAISSAYRLGRSETDFVFAPTIRPGDDHVIGEPSLKVPTLIVQQADTVLAVVADIEHMQAVRNPVRYCFDLEADPRIVETPVLGFGLKDHSPEALLYYQHTDQMRRELPAGKLSYSYYVFAYDGQKPGAGFRHVLRFLWSRFGAPVMTDPAKGLPVTAEGYAQYGFDYALRHLWVDIPTADGGMAGGLMCGIRYPDDIWFHSLFNGLNGAYALHHFGGSMNNADWKSRSRRVRQLLLSSPQEKGIFPTIFHSQVRYARRDSRWVASSHWMLTAGMEEACVTFQNQNFSKAIDWEHMYNTVQCSYTADLLLRWHREAEAHEESVEFCRRYGDFLVEHQPRNGSIPTFYRQGSLRADDIMRFGAETACSAMFLAHLYIVTKDARYLEAARKAERYMAQEIVPINKWQDHETFFDSCGKPIDFFDPHTRQYAQATQCIAWTAEMYRLLAEASGEKHYLESGEIVLDFLSLYQQTWQAPFRSVPTVGGFAVGNGHAAWNDARQGLVAPIYAKYFEQTGNREYLERAVGAARAGLALMFVPEHSKAAPGMYDKGPLGHADENYAHRGEDRAALIGYCFDYQVGGSLSALSYLQKRHGKELGPGLSAMPGIGVSETSERNNHE